MPRVGSTTISLPSFTGATKRLVIANLAGFFFVLLALAATAIHALIEIDCDGHRAGVLPESPELLAVAQILVQAAWSWPV